MNEGRTTLFRTLVDNDDPCAGYYLSFNYSTLGDDPQHFAVRIRQIAVTENEEVIIETFSPDDDSIIVRRRFSGEYTSLEDPGGLGGVWFRVEHADYGDHGLWVCISPEPQTMGLVTR